MNTGDKGGWLSSTKSFFSGVAKEVGSLVQPIPDQSMHSNAGALSSPIGNSYQTQQQNGYGQPNQYGQPQQQQQQPYGQQGYQQQQQQQPQPNGSPDYMGQFDSQLNREMNGSQRYAGGGSNVPSPSPNRVAPGGYGQVDSSWGDQSDGLLPVVPLATQYAGSKPGSRRASIDASTTGAFPTSHFPTSPVNAVSQQLQPMNHPNYHQQPRQLNLQPPSGQANVHNISEFTGVSTLSGSPSPPPAQPTGIAGGYQQPYNPLMQSAAYPPQPNQQPNAAASAAPVNGRPGGVWYPGGSQPLPGGPVLKPVSYDAAPPVFNPALASQHTQPPSAVASIHQAVPQARRVLDENSINPSLGAPQPNSAYGQPSNGYMPQHQQQQQQPPSSGYAPPASSMNAPPPVQSYGYSAPASQLSSPGRVLSPAFNTGTGPNQTVPAGNLMARPMPDINAPPQQMNQSQQQQQQPYGQAPPSQGGYGQQPPQGMPSGGSGLPPPPPVSNYWKQRAAVAGPDAPVLGGRVDYSDLDYKSMDFAYDNRYERDQQPQHQQGQGASQHQASGAYAASTPPQPSAYGRPPQGGAMMPPQQPATQQGNYNPYAR